MLKRQSRRLKKNKSEIKKASEKSIINGKKNENTDIYKKKLITAK